MIRAYIGALLAVLTLDVWRAFGPAWGLFAVACELAGLGLIQLAQKAAAAALRAAAPKGGRA